MYEPAEIECPRDTPDGTRLEVLIPGKQLSGLINDKGIKKVEIRLDDGRHISIDQRKKAYATIRDISDWSGYIPEVEKEWMKYLHISLTGCEYFSLSNCSMDTAREFINTLMAYALENGIPLSDFGVNRTDDIDKYLWYTLKTKKCCVCGRDGEIHHVDRIGMGRNRHKVDDSEYRKMCLCRIHHTICHDRGQKRFDDMYHVHGIIFNEIPGHRKDAPE